MKRKQLCSCAATALACALTALLSSPCVLGASATWNGATDALWATATNWSANPVPGTGDTATFNNAGNGNVIIDLGAGVTASGLVFGTNAVAAYTIGSAAGQSLTLDGAGAITLNSDAANSQWVNANLLLGTVAGDEAFSLTNKALPTHILTIAGDVSSNQTGIKTLSATDTGISDVTGIISDGTGTLAVKNTGAGVLNLSATNTYTGGTTVTAGALSFRNTHAKPATGTTDVSAGAALGLGVSGASPFSGADLDLAFANNLTNVTFASGAMVGIDTTGGDFSYGVDIASSPCGLAKLGANTLTVSGNKSLGGNVAVRAGTLEITGGTLATSGHFSCAVDNSRPETYMTGGAIVLSDASKWFAVGIFNNGNNPATMVMSGNSTITAGNFSVGGQAGGPYGSGEFCLKDEAVINTSNTSLGFYVQGDGSQGTAHMLLRDHARINCTRLTISSNFGTLTQTGGEVNCSTSLASQQWLRIANGMGRWAWYNMTAGKMNVNAGTGGAGFIFSVGTNRGFGIINLTGTAEINMANDVDFRLCSNQTGTLGYFGEVNLAGGTLATPKITSPDLGGDVWGGFFNFNGGTLKATRDEPSFMQTLKAANNPIGGSVWVYSGHAVIDTNGFNIGITEPLREPLGQGVTGIAFDPGSQTYAAPPRVSFSNAPGNVPASAAGFATLDDSGHINGIIITKPGFGYAAAPTVSFDRGDATATATISTPPAGGLVKQGLGDLTLNGVNTYVGDTRVEAGTLTLASGAALKFKIAGNGVNNQLKGTGTANLDGAFNIDVSSGAAVVGNSWTLIDDTSLTVNIGASFVVDGWIQDGTTWTLPDGLTDKLWSFDSSTGVLTYLSAATPYELWAAGYPTADLTDPAADYDGDGMSNLQEFAFGLNPTLGTSCNPVASVANLLGPGQFTYTRSVGTGLTYSIWTSTDLSSWTEATATQNAGTPSDGVETVTVTLTPVPTGAKWFVRVKATDAP